MCNTSFVAEFGAYMSGQAVGSDIEFVEVPGMGPNVVIRDEEKIAEIQKVVTDNKLLGLICRGVKYVPTEVQTVNNNGTLMTMFKYFLQPSIDGDSYSICTVMSNIISLTTTQISRLAINDEATAEDTVWSSSKVDNEIGNAITEEMYEDLDGNTLLGGVVDSLRLGFENSERLDNLSETIHIVKFDYDGNNFTGPTPSEAARAIKDGCVPVIAISEGENNINRFLAQSYYAADDNSVQFKCVSWDGQGYSPILFIVVSDGEGWTLIRKPFSIS